MRASEILWEFEMTKNTWELILSNSTKREVGNNLIDLVQNAYNNTPDGSFVNAIREVIPSHWHVIDHDQDPDIDATVFYRKNRPGEAWIGSKIQDIGHDGKRESKDYAINKLQSLLNRNGNWIEASDAMQHILNKINAPTVTDEKVLKMLFQDESLEMIDSITYRRKLGNGKTITESVFGKPKLR
jgi:hypothetical protein